MKEHRIIGLKYSHDASVALIENGRLVFATELEKINNSPRYMRAASLADFTNAFAISGHYFMDEQSTLVIDGWTDKSVWDDRSDFKTNKIGMIDNFDMPVSGYNTINVEGLTFEPCIGSFNFPYKSYGHLLGHIMATYCTSSFSKDKEDCYVLFSDGGLNGCVLYLNPNEKRVEYVAEIAAFTGTIYGFMGKYFGPFKDPEVAKVPLIDGVMPPTCGLDIAGKIMAYIAHGSVIEELMDNISAMYDITIAENKIKFPKFFEHEFLRNIMQIEGIENYNDATILRCIHEFIQRVYIAGVKKHVPRNSNLIFCGGSALNIKWNNAIRRDCEIDKFWICPVPNDSGSAIGMACCEMAFVHDHWHLEWGVYSGAHFILNSSCEGTPMEPYELGQFIANNNEEPVLCLYGRAEIGPRSLGHRSILMSPMNANTKDKLNKIKGREGFRPIAPICLVEDAKDLFHPGHEDKYMLFEHEVKFYNSHLIPAVIHIDGSARLQTVSGHDCKIMHKILSGVKSVSKFGVLCNTSANFNGTGFLPDLQSAKVFAKKNGIRYIWTKHTLIEV